MTAEPLPDGWRDWPPEAKARLLTRLRAVAPDADTRFRTPHEVQQLVSPHAALNPAHLQAIDEALLDVHAGRCKRLLISLPPQEGKVSGSSERVSPGGSENTDTTGSSSPRSRRAPPSGGADASATTSKPTPSLV